MTTRSRAWASWALNDTNIKIYPSQKLKVEGEKEKQWECEHLPGTRILEEQLPLPFYLLTVYKGGNDHNRLLVWEETGDAKRPEERKSVLEGNGTPRKQERTRHQNKSQTQLSIHTDW